MSYINPIECLDYHNALSILKKIAKKDADGGFYAGVHGLSTLYDSFCDEFKTVYDAFMTKPSDIDAIIWNTMVCALADAGYWTNDIDAFWFSAIHNATDALFNWKNPGTNDATLVLNPVFTAYQGWQFNGVDNYINLNWVASVDGVNYSQNSAHFGIYCRTNIQSNTGGHGTGLNADSKDMWLDQRSTGNLIYFRTNDATSLSGVCNDGSGMFINTRTAAAVNKIYRNSVSLKDGITASIGTPTHSLYIGAYNDDDVAVGWRADQIGCSFVGGGLDQAKITAITNIIEACFDAMGTGVIP